MHFLNISLLDHQLLFCLNIIIKINYLWGSLRFCFFLKISFEVFCSPRYWLASWSSMELMFMSVCWWHRRLTLNGSVFSPRQSRWTVQINHNPLPTTHIKAFRTLSSCLILFLTFIIIRKGVLFHSLCFLSTPPTSLSYCSSPSPPSCTSPPYHYISSCSPITPPLSSATTPGTNSYHPPSYQITTSTCSTPYLTPPCTCFRIPPLPLSSFYLVPHSPFAICGQNRPLGSEGFADHHNRFFVWWFWFMRGSSCRCVRFEYFWFGEGLILHFGEHCRGFGWQSWGRNFLWSLCSHFSPKIKFISPSVNSPSLPHICSECSKHSLLCAASVSSGTSRSWRTPHPIFHAPSPYALVCIHDSIPFLLSCTPYIYIGCIRECGVGTSAFPSAEPTTYCTASTPMKKTPFGLRTLYYLNYTSSIIIYHYEHIYIDSASCAFSLYFGWFNFRDCWKAFSMEESNASFYLASNPPISPPWYPISYWSSFSLLHST